MRTTYGLACVFSGILALVSSCSGSIKVATTHRSGPIDDDYVEEPLSAKARRYEHALEVSNAILQKLQAHDSHSVYLERIDSLMKSEVPESTFEGWIRTIDEHFGSLKSFKPMQWGFKVWSENGKDLVSSTKLVEHERGMVRYHFLFADDGKYETLLGFYMYQRHGVAAPGVP
jgi:hypothetical protein